MKKLLLFFLVIPVFCLGQIPVLNIDKNIFSMDSTFSKEAISKGYYIAFNRWIRQADMNNDGKLDYVVQAYQHSNRGGILSVLINQSSATKSRYVNSFTGNLYTEGDPGLFDLGDVNGDNLIDILAPTQNYHGDLPSKELSWYPDGGDHTFDKLFLNQGSSFKKILFPDNYNTESGRLLNISGDGKKEILISNYSTPMDTDPNHLDQNILYKYELIDDQLFKSTTFKGNDNQLFIRVVQSEVIGNKLYFVLNHNSRIGVDSISVIAYNFNDSLSVHAQHETIAKIVPKQIVKGNYTFKYYPVIDFGIHIADLNRDGKFEVITHEYSQIKDASGANVDIDIGISHTRIQVYDHTGNISDRWLDSTVQYDPVRVAHGNGIKIEDLNDDGLPDILPVNGWGWWRWDNGDPAIRKEIENKRVLLNTGEKFKSFTLTFKSENDFQTIKNGAFFYPFASSNSKQSDILFMNDGSQYASWENTNGVIKLDFSQFKFPCETNKPSISLAESFTFCSASDSLVIRSGAESGMSVRWYNGNALVSTNPDLSVKTSGTFRIVVTNLGGCSSEKVINVTKIENPTATITASGPTTITQTGNVVLSANTGTGLTYQWYKDGSLINTATSSTYTASTGGSYTVKVSNATGCETLSTATVVKTVFVLPANNYQVNVQAETCRTSDNGKVSITALQNLNYSATLSKAGQTVKTANFNTTAELSSLAAGSYTLCITIAGQSEYKQCYDITITEPEDLSVYTQVNLVTNTLDLTMSGSDSYTINLNGQTYTSNSPRMSLALSAGLNKLTVNATQACQGIYTEEIYVDERVELYPNPFTGTLNIKIENQENKELNIKVLNASGTTVYQARHRVNNKLISLDLSQLESGYYFVVIGKQTYKAIKK